MAGRCLSLAAGVINYRQVVILPHGDGIEKMHAFLHQSDGLLHPDDATWLMPFARVVGNQVAGQPPGLNNMIWAEMWLDVWILGHQPTKWHSD